MSIVAVDAEALFESGRFEDALAAFRELATTGPGEVRVGARVGACLIALARYDEAIAVLEPLVATAPDHPLLGYRLAVARAGAGDPNAALDALDAAASAGLRAAVGIDSEPALERLRGGARFVAIRRRIDRNDHPTADDPRFRAFDFWAGTWEARTPDGIRQGVNRIEVVLGGAALIERWSGASGYRGISLNRYDRTTDRWRQTWVDDQGDIVEFEDGVVSDGRLTFIARDADGERRLTFTDLGPDAFRQLSERSSDGGATWTTEYDFRYRRLAE
jgi:tetratricopeptide (TPR) repeat protein